MLKHALVLSVLLHVAALEAAAAGAKTYDLKGLSVSVFPPVLLAKRTGRPMLCYPKLARLANGEIAAMIWLGGDNYGVIGDGQQGFCFSRDDGATWSEPEYIPKVSGNRGLLLPSGDFAFLTYALYPRPGGMGGPYYLIPKGSREVKYQPEGVEITGWPRPDTSLDAKKGITGFVCHGQTVKLKDGTYLATLYGHFAETKRYSLVLADSRDGLHWKIRSIIHDEKDDPMPRMSEGANESAIAQLKDGRLMCIFRTGGPYGQTWSADGGKTWSKPERALCAGDVEPSLAVFGDGTVALATGRNLDLSFNLDGSGKTWQEVSIKDHQKSHHSEEVETEKGQPYGGTSGYPHILVLSDTRLLYIYDRWLTTGTSVWAVRVDIVKK